MSMIPAFRVKSRWPNWKRACCNHKHWVKSGACCSCSSSLPTNQWDLQLGHIKGAFLEAGPVAGKYHPLFAKQPGGGIPGVPVDAVIEVVGNVYEQNDAPLAWYRAFDAAASVAGWERGKFGSCSYSLRDSHGRLAGVMGVHVDDTAVGGHGEVFSKAIAHLKSRFPYIP